MTPHEFVAKWRGVELKERSASQSHFNDLCALLDEPGALSYEREQSGNISRDEIG